MTDAGAAHVDSRAHTTSSAGGDADDDPDAGQRRWVAIAGADHAQWATRRAVLGSPNGLDTAADRQLSPRTALSGR
ncbi:MAG: hypothetical protein QM733_05135 [Ilumatobacteraceae bacterium]